MTLTDMRAVLLYACIAVSLAFVDHRVRREQFREHVVKEYIPSVLAGTSGAPAKYRVLMPYLLDGATRALGSDPYTLFLFSELLFIAAALLVTHAYLRRWYSPGASTAGTMAMAAVIPLTFTNTWAHPDTFPDLFLFTSGCLAVAARRDMLLLVVVLIGMLNRETMGFIGLLWAAERLREPRRPGTIRQGVMLFAICAGSYAALRWVRGFEPYEMWMLPRNFTYLSVLPAGFDPYTRVAGFFWAVLLAVPGYLAFTGSRRDGAPRFFRSAWYVALLFILVAWLFAAIIETRVFLPVLPLLLPGALGAFAQPLARERHA